MASLHSAALAGLGEAMLETDPAGAAELATRALKVRTTTSQKCEPVPKGARI